MIELLVSLLLKVHIEIHYKVSPQPFRYCLLQLVCGFKIVIRIFSLSHLYDISSGRAGYGDVTIHRVLFFTFSCRLKLRSKISIKQFRWALHTPFKR
jgi:hypothetical protein